MITTSDARNQGCSDGRVSRAGRYAAAAVAALAVGGLGLGTVAAPASADLPGAPCLWAGNPYPDGETVYAGGWAFTCHSDFMAGARWNRDGVANRRTTVPNPGANGNPAGRFSPGARQPGTAYTDYCVGDQLIEGAEDIYEAFPAGGGLYWKAAGPISNWTFDGARPEPTWRTSSSCREGSLS
ncbi:hypothetical protein [Nocardia mexicana]|uniref:Uncharacterized protein n=1 Tax=Nocardia mexicana TaxID=279262 RepID=A0A370HC67_9NOCA|nr:hypothetical protein [Nocardia mexicana]RDI54519.1 hypothetical protein DFR68_102647 [Nocardia mexicana]